MNEIGVKYVLEKKHVMNGKKDGKMGQKNNASTITQAFYPSLSLFMFLTIHRI